MAQATITASIDAEDKARFEAICSAAGLDASSAVSLFVKAVLREGCFPFPIDQPADPFFGEPNLSYVKKSVQELRDGKGTAHALIEADDD